VNLSQLLIDAATDAPSAEALVYRNTRITYAELAWAVDRCAVTLNRRGIRPGDFVAIVCGNHPGFAVGLLGALRAGAVAAPINPQFRRRELEVLLSTTGAKAVIADAERRELCDEALGATGGDFVLEMGEDGAIPETLYGDVGVLPGDDAPAVCQFSTGTTGRPKQVVRTHGQVSTEVESTHGRLHTTDQDVILGSVPLFHAHGLCNCLMAALRCRGRLMLTGGFYARSILNLIESEGVTIWPTVPFMVRILVEMPGPKERHLPSLRLVYSAGAPLDAEVSQRFELRYGTPVRQLYGCTEMGAFSINDDGAVPETLASVGLPLPGNDVRIVGAADEELPAGSVGQVALSGPSLTLGYASADESAQANFRDGRFYPGDIGFIGEDGRLWLQGRTQLFINVGGNKVDPEEVERILTLHEDVADVAVVRAPHHYYGEVVRAVIVPEEGTDIDENDIRRHCREALADFKVPKEIVLRDRIPRSPMGKLLRKYLEDGDLEG
jgi:long-chain acyl-CoA synthetase